MREGSSLRIAALDDQAAACGLRMGMGVADARAMHPGIEVVEADAAADRRLIEAIADWCDRYTPLVALSGPDGLFLDVTGCVHLFGGEQAMLDDIGERLSAQGLHARAGLASTPGMAWAAARFLEPVPVAPGAEADALASLRLAALRLEPDLCASLESVGLRTVDAVMAAPRAPLARRFGSSLLLRLDQALGRLEEAVSPRRPVAVLSVERHLAEPVVLIEDVERLVGLLSARMKTDLERREEGVRLAELALFRVDGAVRRLTVGAARPLRNPVLVQRLFRERIAGLGEAIESGFGFELVRLSALETAPFVAEQGNLAGEDGDTQAGLAHLADRVRARLGATALVLPQPRESHIPERAVEAVPFALLRPADAPDAAPLPDRPVRLLARPEPVEVTAVDVPEGPPLRFRWRRALHRIARAEGPERIAPEWWRDADDAMPRDYFRVEDEDGRRFWIYRQGLYGATPAMPRWFMHGFFA